MNVLDDSHPAMAPVLKIRAKRREQFGMLADLEKTPVTETELREAIGADLDAQLARHDPAGAVWPYARTNSAPERLRLDSASMLVALLGRDKVIDALVSVLIKDGYDPKAAISAEDRATKTQAIRAKLSEFEDLEERANVKVESATGCLVIRRPDIDPRVIFEVWDDVFAAEGGSRKYLRQLGRAGHAKHRAVLAYSDEYIAGHAEVQAATAELARLESGYRHLREPWSGASSEARSHGDKQIARCKRELAEARERMLEAESARDKEAAEWQAFVRPIRALMEFTGTERGVKVTPNAATAPPPDKDTPFARNAVSEAALEARKK
ncbi:MAG: hypothetical protein RIC56_03795 [Pseudomonadales bacterium]